MKTFHGFALALILGLSMAAATGIAHPVSANNGGRAVHTVALGETLYSIARHYGVSAEEIAAANGVMNLDYIYAGQQLVIPGDGPAGRPAPAAHGGGQTHLVQLGETLYGIAWKYGVSVSAILAANGIGNPDYIYAGQQLAIPGGWAPEPAPGGGWVDPGPGCGHRHAVKPGETLSGIAWHHDLSIGAIARANGIGFPYLIYAGQSLYIPCGEGGVNPGHGNDHGHKPQPGPHRPKPTAQPALHPAACPREVQIVNPRQNEHVSGSVNVVGTANIANLQFYKLEAAMGATPLEGNFFSIGEEVTRVVNDTTLGTWYVGNLPAGTWTLRLTAVDNRGQFPRPCSVTVHVDR